MLHIQAKAILPTAFGNFKIIAFAQDEDEKMPLLLLQSERKPAEIPLVRLHSECMTGDTFSSYRCDCGEQLHRSLEMINETGGYLLYLRQEGRGIGLINKLKAYELQEEGFNTLEANQHLGFKGDEREYAEAVEVLKSMGITSIQLITNNPDKVKYLQDHQIEVVERIPLIIPANKNNRRYLEAKKDKMGHWL